MSLYFKKSSTNAEMRRKDLGATLRDYHEGNEEKGIPPKSIGALWHPNGKSIIVEYRGQKIINKTIKVGNTTTQVPFALHDDGKWYSFHGIDKSGKLHQDPKAVYSHYGNDAIRAHAEHLNDTLGDISDIHVPKINKDSEKLFGQHINYQIMGNDGNHQLQKNPKVSIERIPRKGVGKFFSEVGGMANNVLSSLNGGRNRAFPRDRNTGDYIFERPEPRSSGGRPVEPNSNERRVLEFHPESTQAQIHQHISNMNGGSTEPYWHHETYGKTLPPTPKALR